jgi:AcrR family transcriptional regulator
MKAATDASASRGRREDAKDDRRRRIVEAARDLIRETGDTGLTMRAIAARASVSLATPYNLYGSKRAIAVAVLDDVRDFHGRFAKFRSSDAIERLFKAITITLDYHRQDPAFYMTLWRAILDTAGDAELHELLSLPQSALFWRGLLDEALKQGRLRDDIDLDLLRQDLGFTFAAAMLSWVLGGVTVVALEPTICHGYALTLCAAVTDEHRPALWKRAKECQKKLVQMRKHGKSA